MLARRVVGDDDLANEVLTDWRVRGDLGRHPIDSSSEVPEFRGSGVPPFDVAQGGAGAVEGEVLGLTCDLFMGVLMPKPSSRLVLSTASLLALFALPMVSADQGQTPP